MHVQPERLILSMSSMPRVVRFAPLALVLLALACAGSEEDADTTTSGGSAGLPSGGSGGSGASSGSGGASSGGKGGTSGSGGGSTLAENGAACTASADCKSTWCVDGVCCDGNCTGACRSCKTSGKIGTCALAVAGTDPEAECGDGTSACSGTCDGVGACAYPGAEKLCGAASCQNGKQSADTCDGAGACVTAEKDCGLFICAGSACLGSCQNDADCVPTAFCNPSSGKCEAKKDDGKVCAQPNECTSGVCVSGVCCNTACDAPSACWTGKCLCDKTACATGDKCTTWYADVDADGFGDKTKTKLGCESTGPNDGATYAKNGDDCFDTNSSAKPGQTAYFTTDRGDGSYDYNCNLAKELQYPDVTGLTCGDCGLKIDTVCYSCGVFPGINTYGFGCNATNKCSFTGAKSGYKQSVDCGQSSLLYSCDMCSPTNNTGVSTKQGCR